MMRFVGCDGVAIDISIENNLIEFSTSLDYESPYARKFARHGITVRVNEKKAFFSNAEWEVVGSRVALLLEAVIASMAQHSEIARKAGKAGGRARKKGGEK